MTRFAITAIALVLLAGCASTTQTTAVVDTAAATAELALLENRYEQAKAALRGELSRFPEDDQLLLLALEGEADAYVAKISDLWRGNKALIVADVEWLYQEAQSIYERGEAIVAPHVEDLSPDAQYRLRQLSEGMERLDQQIEQYLTDPDTANKAAMVKAGLTMAALAIELFTAYHSDQGGD